MPKHIAHLISLLLPLSLIACSSTDDRAAGAGAGGGRAGGRGAGAPVPVLTARVVRKAMPVTIPAVGTVEAMATVQIRSQVTGQVSAIHFTEGADVEKGAPLFSLDARPFQAALQQAQAVLARDTATLQNAQGQQARLDNLFQRGLIPRDQYETQRASVSSLAATVEADKAAIETARLNVQYAEIAAPLSGRTGSLGVHIGDMVRANDATPLVVINQLSPVYVTFSVPARFLGDVRRYQAQSPLWVSATLARGVSEAPAPGEDGRGQPGPAMSAPSAGPAPPARPEAARGTVSFIDNAVDPSTGTIRLKGTFENAGHRLWPGAFVQVSLDLTTERDATVVPAVAVQASQEGEYVFVVKPDRTVEMRTVRVGRQQGDEAVVAEGVKPGEEVVTDGHLRLAPGARITNRAEAGREGTLPAGSQPDRPAGGAGRAGQPGTGR